MNIEELRKNNLILFECISGSRAQGLDTEESDTDIRGVFIMPKEEYYGFDYIAQVSNETNDIVFYEIKRFFDLLSKNNPNILEMLNVADEDIVFKDHLLNAVKPELFLSKLCKETFANYAMTQLKRARGLNKKILNPMAEEKKTILDFCFVVKGQGAVPVKEWLLENNYGQEQCGLVNIPHMSNVYAVYYDNKNNLGYQGIIRKPESDMVILSSIPKSETVCATMYCNKDGYSAYCKDYKEYWDWVNKRNETRYKNTIEHGKNYDAKNMMHTFRLLTMAKEILRDGSIVVKRSDRDELLKIKSGVYSYDYLVNEAHKKMDEIENAFTHSTLQDRPNRDLIEEMLIKMRDDYYCRQ